MQIMVYTSFNKFEIVSSQISEIDENIVKLTLVV